MFSHFVHSGGVESEEDEEEDSEAPDGGASVGDEGEGDADDGEESEHHTDVDREVEEENGGDAVGIDLCEALALIHERGLKANYLFDCATRKQMVVPDKAMDDFRKVMDLSTDEGGLIDRPLELGSQVRVAKGPLQGVEGRILELQGRNYVVVSLLDSLFARASVPRAWLEDARLSRP